MKVEILDRARSSPNWKGGRPFYRALADADAPGARSDNPLWSMLPIIAVIFAATLYLQLKTYPNHDVAWVLWGTREMLGGASWGVDIIEPNPPLAWYLSMPSTALASWLDVPLDWTFRVVVALAGAASAIVFTALSCGDSRFRCALLCTVSGACLLLLPGREFGQREHLAAIAVLPYLALAGRRASGASVPSTRTVFAIGLAMGLGVALKPYFLAVPLLVELAIQLMAGRRPKLFRAENVASASVVAGYALILILFGRQYLAQVVPLANDIYWSFNRPVGLVLAEIYPSAMAIIAFAGYSIHKKDRLSLVIFASYCGFSLCYILQRKGYPYHLLPVSIMAMMMLAHLSTSGLRLVRGLALGVMLLLSLSVSQPALNWWAANRPGGSRAIEIDTFRQAIARNSGNGRFLIVAVHPYPAFPVAIYTSAHHVSRTNSHWFLPAVVYNRTKAEKHGNVAPIERHARDFILHDLAALPDLVLIDSNSGRHTVNSQRFDFLAFYLEDPAFRRAWGAYEEIESLGSYRQFVRIPQGAGSSGRPMS